MSALIHLGESLFPYLLDILWQATALIVIVFGVTRLLGSKAPLRGRRRPMVRYWLWVYCLTGLLILPLLSFVAGDHRLRLLRAKAPSAVSHRAVALLKPMSGTINRSPAPEAPDRGLPSEMAPAASPADEPITEPPTINATDSGTASLTAIVPARRPSPAEGAARTHTAFPWRGCISLAWLAGCTIFLMRLVFAAICVARLRRSSSPATDSLLLESFQAAKAASGFRTTAELRVGRKVAAPGSIGIFRPAILLPEFLVREMPPEQLRPVLLHELAHIRWRDYTVAILQRLVETIFFFHPLVHLVNRRVRRLREEICDNWVLNHFPEATVYARALTTLAERCLLPGKSLVGVGLFYHPVILRQRIERILAPGGPLSVTLRLRTAMAWLALSLIAVGSLSLTTISARAARPGKEAPPEKKTLAPAGKAAAGQAISWKEDAVYRDGNLYAKIVQWEPEADLPMTAFGDQNNDGKTDTWVRFLNGKPLRIEIDKNEDGRIDRWEHYYQGVIDLVEQDTDFNRRVDLWQVYDKGKLFREEIDENADGSVDKWLEVDEKGKLVEKEIFSWTVEKWVETEFARESRADPRAYAAVTFFNARDRVEKTEDEPTSESESTPLPVPAPRRPGARPSREPTVPQSPYRASAGSRIEYSKEVNGVKVVSAWFHQSLFEEDARPDQWRRRGLYPYPRYQGARYLAFDRGFDGGADSREQIGPPIPEGSRPSDQLYVLFRVATDDLNRDGRSDSCYIGLAQDESSRQIAAEISQVDSNNDGLMDRYDASSRFRRGWSTEYMQTSLLDFDKDGAFDSFGPYVRVPSYIEPVGSSVLEVRLEASPGQKPTPLLCKLELQSDGSGRGHGRGFWLVPGETATFQKLSRGVYNLALYVEYGDRRASIFKYPSFCVLEKGQTVSKALGWDTRPLFRGKLLDDRARPLKSTSLILSLPGKLPASIELHTDQSGDFEIFNAPPGHYLLLAKDHAFRQTIEIPPPGEGTPEQQLVLTNITQAEPRYRPPRPGAEEPPAWEAPIAASGKVLSHRGEPLSNMKLVVAEVLPDKETGITRTAITGLDGSYSILIVPPGRYSVSIYNNDFPDQKPFEQLSMEIEEMPVRKDFRLSGPLPVIVE